MTRPWEHFRYQEQDGVATVTFDRPDRLNALTFEVYADLRDLTAELAAAHDRVRVLVLRGEGRAFCSGGDVEDIIGQLLQTDTRGVYDFARMTGACVRNMRQMPQPIIAAVNGTAAGAGAVLAMASDIRVFSTDASIQFLFTRVGISGGDMGISWLLPRAIGIGPATELLMLGGRVEAQQALDLRIANRVVAPEDLDKTVAQYVEKFGRVSPWGVAMTKELINRSATMDYSTAIESEAWTQTLLMTTQDFHEFHESFVGKRAPKYIGR